MEQARRTPVVSEWDVVIVGGGIAGVAAAVAAARNGAKVCIVEKACALGGLATLGNVAVYLPLCDGRGRQVIAGLGEELLKLSIGDGYDHIPPQWRKGAARRAKPQSGDAGRSVNETNRGDRYLVEFNPPYFMLQLEALAIAEGVTIFYDSRFCDLAMSRGRISAVIIENKSGRLALSARTVVDASGDADVCARAGEQTAALSTNVRCNWFYYFDGTIVRLAQFSKPYHPLGKKLAGGGPWYAGDSGRDVSRQIIDSRAMLRARLDELSRSGPARLVMTTTMPTHRMTRRLRGEVELQERDDGRWFEDAVGMTGDWRKPGPVWSIPLRSLLGRTANLIVAGRCISADTVWDVTRAIPTCAVTGQAAGVAAALACRRPLVAFAKLDIARLQATLKRQRVLIDPKLLPKV